MKTLMVVFLLLAMAVPVLAFDGYDGDHAGQIPLCRNNNTGVIKFAPMKDIDPTTTGKNFEPYCNTRLLNGIPTEEMIWINIQGIQGPQGLQGIQGEKGDQGLQGIQGIEGLQGIQGVKGDNGDQGIQGIQGDKGDKGDQGVPGIGSLGVFNGDGTFLGYLVWQKDDATFTFIEPTYHLLVTITLQAQLPPNNYAITEEILQTWYASNDCSGDSRWSPHKPANALTYISYGERYAIDDPTVPRVWCDAADPGGCPIHSYRDSNGVCWYRDAPQTWFYKVRIVSSPLPTLIYPVYVATIEQE